MNELHVLSKLVAAISDLPAWESDELHRAYSDAVRHLRGMPPPQSMAESLRQVNTQTALETLWSCGLSPVYYTDILSAAHGVKGMVETLRGMLADPPPDVQELVIKKIGLRHVGGGIFHSETQTPNDLGNRRDAGPIGGASVLTDELCGNGSEVGAGDTAMKGKQ